MNRRAGTRWVRAGLLPVFGIAAYGLAAHGLLHLVPEPDWVWDVWRDLAVLVLPPALWLIWRLRHGLHETLGLTAAEGARSARVPVLALLGGLALTVVLVARMEASQQALAQAHFDNEVARATAELRDRMERPLSALLGLRALYAANAQFKRLEFVRYVSASDISNRFPAALGFGFIEPVRRGALDAFLERERADDAPDFTLHAPGEAGEWLYVIKYIEPMTANRPAWGLNLGFEATRREAIEAAIQSGEARLSGVVPLVQGGEARSGLLLMLPVHDADAMLDTPEHRRHATAGLVYAPLLLRRMFDGLDSMRSGELDFDVADVTAAGQPVSLRQANGDTASTLATFQRGASGTARVYRQVQRVAFAGRQFDYYFWSTEAFATSVALGWQPIRLGLLGSVISAFLAVMLWLMATSQVRAQKLAERMTVDLLEATAKVQASQQERERLITSLNEHCIVSITDVEGRIIEANAAFEQISGYARDELIGQNHRLVNSGLHPPEFWHGFWDTICTGQPWHGEVCNRRKDGGYYWVKTTVMPFFDTGGRVDRYVSIRTDVTDEHLLRAELQGKHERFSLALEGGNDGLWDWLDTHSQAMWWSPQFYRLLGHEPDAIQASIAEFDAMQHPGDRARTQAALAAALQDDAPYDVEFRLRTRSGDYRWFRSRAKVFRDTAGLHRRMAGSLQDIHDLKSAEADLSLRNAQMAAVFAITPDAYVSMDDTGHVQFVSPAFERLTGLGAEAAARLDLEALLTRLAERGKFTPDLAAHWPTELAAGSLSYEPAQGQRRTLGLRLHTAPEAGPVSSLLLIHDITHQVEVEQIKSEFLSTAAHELRTPMASILGFSELLATREFSEERRQGYLARILRQARAMMAILNELLDLQRIESRRGKDFVLAVCDLRELVREAAQDYPPPAGREAPALRLPPEPAVVRIDRSKLQQALRNLISNAYKYSPQGGPVQLHLQRVGEAWQLDVTDHGIGLTPEQAARVCERFYRADSSGGIAGTGLGMSIVKEIVELHGGQLQLQSVYGQGTTVMLRLPVHEGPLDMPLDMPLDTP